MCCPRFLSVFSSTFLQILTKILLSYRCHSGKLIVAFIACLVAYEHFHLLRFPFDTKNPIGYLIAVILEYIIFVYAYFIIACTLSLAMGAFWFAISGTEEFQRFSTIINAKAQANLNQIMKIKTSFTEFFEAHGIVKQLSKQKNYRLKNTLSIAVRGN